ncbi:MAG: 3-dehydroquinate synthase [Pseudomonadota bacterium]|nr:3-dehydroquinate synthase [Pseudomonadota bacterium]
MKIIKKIKVDLGARSYPIIIGNGIYGNKNLYKNSNPKNSILVSTKKIKNLKKSSIPKKFYNSEILIGDGENFKNLNSCESIYKNLLKNKYSRDCCLLAYGGGVIGDITGYVAATYLRGVNFIQVPTTLLSMVDSSVGGKTGVNHSLGKNMIGAFYQPQSVIIDLDSLKTLPKKQFSAGMAEVIKYGVIYDKQFFEWLEKNKKKIISLDRVSLAKIIATSCKIKAEIVAKDEKESGIRAILNLGHTFGHAIEKNIGYGRWTHGAAVACGMVIASELSEKLGKLSKNDLNRIKNLLSYFDLPIKLPKKINASKLYEAMKNDKKVLNNKIRLIIPKKIGECFISDKVSKSNILKTLEINRDQ